ncbi:MAG: right-handed parallel beta-helix repeat-containing protein [Candidatus Cloacimonetes bacterium]|nr:right-handed parallel beta-helix repeat-containing protein [Candidatus Cloacimonadota bacterium]
MRKLTGLILLIAFLFTNKIIFALPKILVDCVHGFDCTDDLQSMYPDFEFEKLDGEDFPIENILAQGTLPTPDSLNFQVFYVPENTEHLYIITDDYYFEWDFFAYMEDPNGEFIGLFQGIREIENPIPGTWTIINQNLWGDVYPFNYIIGTGPHFFESIDISYFSAYYRLWNNSLNFFLGNIIEYTQNEEQILQDWVNDGLGFLSLYNYQYDVVPKPVIRLYDTNKIVDVKISFDGIPIYQSPKPIISHDNKLTSYQWTDVKPKTEYVELLYEIGKTKPPNFLLYHVQGNQIEILNQSPYPIYGLYCIKSHHDRTYEIAETDNILSKQNVSLNTHRITRSELIGQFNEQLPSYMNSRCLPNDVAIEFFKRYHWIDRLLLELSNEDDFIAIYLIDTKAYNGILSLQLSQNPSEIVRQLWMMEKSISQSKPVRFTELPYNPIPLKEGEYSYNEYGFYIINHDREALNIFDLSIHNDTFIQDPTNNYNNWPEAPIFHEFGNNEIAYILTNNIDEVYNFHAPYIDFPGNWSPLLLGDEDSFVYGEYPDIICCLVGKQNGYGRILVGGSSYLIGDDYIGMSPPSNYDFSINCLNWISRQDQIIEVPGDYPTINEAIEAAQNGYTIIVDDGTYNESVNFNGKDITVISANGPDNCIILPPASEHVVIFENNETQDAQLIGFTITGATVQAIYIENASATIQDNLIINNQMGNWYFNGAGIYCSNSSAIIENNEIAFNTEGYHGGGIYLYDWDGELINNEIHHNITNAGYGIDYGSGLCLGCSSGYVENNLIYGNESNYVASSFCCYSTNSVIEYNQIIENENIGIKIVGNLIPIINNNDIYGNSLYDAYTEIIDSTTTIDFQYNYWGEETTEEMNSVSYPSNISAIYDIFDNEDLAFIDYDNWLDSSNTSVDDVTEIPYVSFNLKSFPNPFTTSTTISFFIPNRNSKDAVIKIYNIKGQLIKELVPDLIGDTSYELGVGKAKWDGKDKQGDVVSSGIYFYQLQIDNKIIDIKKCLLMK